MGVNIQRCFKILHFLEFKALKRLEFDTRILRSRKGEHQVFPPLTKILPQTVEVVGIIIDDHRTVQQLLDSLPATKAELPHLHTVFIRFRIVPTGSLDSKTDSLLCQLREQCEQVSLTVRWQVVANHHNYRPRLDWGNKPNVIDDFDAYFFQNLK
jgi:hypothetical protein